MRLRKGSLQSDQMSELRLLIKESKTEIINVLGEDLKNVKQRLDSLTSRFTALEESVLSIQQKHEKLEAEISGVKTEMKAVMDWSCRQTFQEMDGRLLKMTDIIIRGLSEGTGTVEERAEQDVEAVNSLLASIEVDSEDVTDVRRLGKMNGGKPRLLRATFPNPTRRQEALRKAKLLRSSRFKNVYIQPDRTRMQQETERSLRKELKDRREQGEDVVLYRGEVRSRHGLTGFHL